MNGSIWVFWMRESPVLVGSKLVDFMDLFFFFQFYDI